MTDSVRELLWFDKIMDKCVNKKTISMDVCFNKHKKLQSILLFNNQATIDYVTSPIENNNKAF